VSTHIEAEPGAIAERILLPGDPLRAKWVAETFLDEVFCYSSVRNMLGYTGSFEGVPVSVQGTGMGVPSISIYAHELFAEYGVRTAIRIGTAGALRLEVKVRDVVLAQGASTDSGTNRRRFPGVDFAALADFDLLSRAWASAVERGLPVHVGGVITSDTFYGDLEATLRLGEYGIVAVEMETNALYTVAAQFGVRALAVLTISDHLVTGEQTSAQERQQTFSDMVEVALRTAIG